MANFEESDEGLVGEGQDMPECESLFVDEEGELHCDSEDTEEMMDDPYDSIEEDYE